MLDVVLMQETRVIGRVNASPCGAYFKLCAVCRTPLNGIWRAYLVRNEREWLIGVMEPQTDGSFCAGKQVPKTEISEFSSCYGIIRQECWVLCDKPQTVFRDPPLMASMKTAHGVLADSCEHPTKIAVPLKHGCACAPALCLAHMMCYRGEEYAVLGVDENGNPVPLSEQKRNSIV